MKLELLPDFAKPFKTKGYDVRLVKNSYQLFRVTSKRVEGKKYPVLSQEYIGTIDPVKGLLPKKVVVKTGVNDALVEYGLSYFMYKRFNRELKRSLFNAGGNATPLTKLAIIKFIYGHCEERFVRLTYLGRDFEFLPLYTQPSYLKRIDKLLAKIQQLFTLLVPDHADRDYLIALLRDIKISTSVLSTTIDYSDDIKAIFIKYGIKYE